MCALLLCVASASHVVAALARRCKLREALFVLCALLCSSHVYMQRLHAGFILRETVVLCCVASASRVHAASARRIYFT